MLFWHTVLQLKKELKQRRLTRNCIYTVSLRCINTLFQMIFEQIVQVRRQIWDNISQQHLPPFLTTPLLVSLLESQA